MRGSSKYKGPSFLEEALLYGYISPNLQAPRGHKWLSRPGGVFELVSLGG